jgi:DNA-binding GntR family transcriptional regulator
MHVIYHIQMLPTLTQPTLAERAYTALLDAIVTGELAPGDRLRDQELATRFGISRTPVREALRRLEDEGLVESVPHAYTRVAPVRATKIADAFPVVAALQALGARLGVPHLTPEDIARMESHDAERTQALEAGHVTAAIAADDRFHDVLLDAAGNEEIARLLTRVMPHIRRLDLLHFEALTHETDPTPDHAEIIAACRRGDAPAAAALVERNFLRLGEQMAAVLATDGRKSAEPVLPHGAAPPQ